MHLNKALIVGHITKDPEMKALPSGMKVTSFSIATNRVWKDKDGQKQEAADFHNIIVFGAQAESSSKYLRKGQLVLVEGRLQTRSWDAGDGSKKYRTEIIAERVQFGPKSSGVGPGENGTGQIDSEKGKPHKTPYKAKSKPAGAPAVVPPGGEKVEDGQIEYPTEEINPDDIPF